MPQKQTLQQQRRLLGSPAGLPRTICRRLGTCSPRQPSPRTPPKPKVRTAYGNRTGGVEGPLALRRRAAPGSSLEGRPARSHVFFSGHRERPLRRRRLAWKCRENWRTRSLSSVRLAWKCGIIDSFDCFTTAAVFSGRVC